VEKPKPESESNSRIKLPSIRLSEDNFNSHPSSSTPSISPPSSPPSEEYMKSGWDADDKYRMVEDEFYDIARSFTNHLHQAEYARVKKLALDRGSTTTTITRPVITTVKGLSDSVRRRKDRIQRTERQEKAIQKARGLSTNLNVVLSDEELKAGNALVAEVKNRKFDQWIGTKLEDLMAYKTPEKQQAISLRALRGRQSRTRASAGYSSTGHNRISSLSPRDIATPPLSHVNLSSGYRQSGTYRPARVNPSAAATSVESLQPSLNHHYAPHQDLNEQKQKHVMNDSSPHMNDPANCPQSILQVRENELAKARALALKRTQRKIQKGEFPEERSKLGAEVKSGLEDNNTIHSGGRANQKSGKTGKQAKSAVKADTNTIPLFLA
jgi:hypothetical protein